MDTLEGKSVQYLNGKGVGGAFPVYLVAEAGATHTGLESAKKLVDLAVEAGFDAVKFQRVDADKIPNPDEMFGNYRKYDILKQRMLTEEEWVDLSIYAHRSGIFSFNTVTDVDLVRTAQTAKIASRWITDLNLILNVAARCGVVQLDTGGASLEDIGIAISAVESEKAGCIIHHCPKGYPAEPENEHLGYIKKYKHLFGYPVAYSSHTATLEMDLMALAVGADLLEVPVMEWDSRSISPEARYALRRDEAIRYVNTVRKAEKAL